jgi:hypothetical protein
MKYFGNVSSRIILKYGAVQSELSAHHFFAGDQIIMQKT